MSSARAGRGAWGGAWRLATCLRRVPVWGLLLFVLANLPLYHYHLGRIQPGPHLTLPHRTAWKEEVSSKAYLHEEEEIASVNASLEGNRKPMPPSVSLLALMLRPASPIPLYPQHGLLQYYVLCIHWVEFMLLSGADSIHWVDMSPQPDAFLSEEDIFRWYTSRSIMSHSRILQSSEPQKRDLGILRTAAIILAKVRPQWVVLCHRPGDLPWVPGYTPLLARRNQGEGEAASVPLWDLLVRRRGAGLHTRDAVLSPVFNTSCMVELFAVTTLVAPLRDCGAPPLSCSLLQNLTQSSTIGHQNHSLASHLTKEATEAAGLPDMRMFSRLQGQPQGVQLPGLLRLSFFSPEGSTIDRIFMALHVLGVDAILGLRKRTEAVAAERQRGATSGPVKPLLSVGLGASSLGEAQANNNTSGTETPAQGSTPVHRRRAQRRQRRAWNTGRLRRRRSLLQDESPGGGASLGTPQDRNSTEGRRRRGLGGKGEDPSLVFVALLEAPEWREVREAAPLAEAEWESVARLLRSQRGSLQALENGLLGSFAAAKRNVHRLLLRAAVDTLSKGLTGLQNYRNRLLAQTKAKAEAQFLFLTNNPSNNAQGHFSAEGREGDTAQATTTLSLQHWNSSGGSGSGVVSGQRRLLVTAEELRRWHRKHTQHKQRLQAQREEEIRAAQQQGQEADCPPGLEATEQAQSLAGSSLEQRQGQGRGGGGVGEGVPGGKFLAALVFNRMYDEDAFHMTSFQLMQWIEYHLYAGVERIYWYDMARAEYESQESALRPYVEAGLVVYSRFHRGRTLSVDIDFEQSGAIQDFIRVAKGEYTWALLCDVDEYVFMPSDTRGGFLRRLLKHQQPSVSQLVLRNMFFMAPPVPLPQGALLIERFRHRNATATEPPRRTKPILKLDSVGPYSGNPHRFSMDKGTSVTQHPGVVRLNHYWGLRLHGFQPMPREEWAQCIEDYSIQPLADVVRRKLRWQASWSPAFELQKSTWLLRQGLQLLRRARNGQEELLATRQAPNALSQESGAVVRGGVVAAGSLDAGAVAREKSGVNASTDEEALAQPLVLRFREALQRRNHRAESTDRGDQTVHEAGQQSDGKGGAQVGGRGGFQSNTREGAQNGVVGGMGPLADVLVLMLRVPEREDWGRAKGPEELAAYYSHCLEWIELSLQAGVKAVWWVDFSPAPAAGPREEEVFAKYIASSQLVYQRQEFTKYMKELYILTNAVATAVAEVKPQYVLLCHRPGDFFQLNESALRAQPFLGAPHPQRARQLLQTDQGGAPHRRAETSQEVLGLAAVLTQGGRAQRGLLQAQEQGGSIQEGQERGRVQGREGERGVSLAFRVDAHALVSAWEGAQGRLRHRGGSGAGAGAGAQAWPQAGAPPPPVSVMSGEGDIRVDPSVSAALAASAEMRVKRNKTCKIAKLDIPTIVIQQRHCDTTQGAASLDCLTRNEQALPGTSYLLLNPALLIRSPAPEQPQADPGPPLSQHPPPTPPPPPQEPPCSPLSPMPSLLAVTYLSPELRLQDVEAALLGLGKESLFGCQGRFEPMGATSTIMPSSSGGAGGIASDRGADREGEVAGKGGGSEGLQPGTVHRWLQQGFFLSVQDIGKGHRSFVAPSASARAAAEQREGQGLGASGGASAMEAGFLSHGVLWESAGKKVREARGELQARAAAAREGIREFCGRRQHLLALDSGVGALHAGLQDLQEYFARILSHSKAADEAQYLHLCNEPRAQVDGTQAQYLRNEQRAQVDGQGGGAAPGAESEDGGSPSPGTGSSPTGLVAVVFNRIYQGDGFNMTSYELWQWIEYYLYAGVEKVYWYDMARSEGESQRGALQQYRESGQLHYTPFHALYPPNFDIHYEQDNAVRHFLRTYRVLHRYALFVDVDEYVFMPQDTRPGFLGRLVGSVFANGSFAEVLVKNVFFPAPPLPLAPGALLTERYQHRNATPEPGTSRAKALVDLRCVKGVFPGQPHALPLRCGHTLEADPSVVRLNHYWGLRTKGYAPLHPGEWRTYVHDTSILPIARVIRKRLEWLYGMLPAFQIERPLVHMKGALEFLQSAQNALLKDLV